MPRRLKSGVLEAFCKFTEDTEVPAAFAVWSGMITIAASLGRDCFIDYGYYTLYPNMYIVLIGPSAVAKKSTPIKFAARMIKQVKPPVNMLSQKMTPEALISALSGLDAKEGDTMIVPSAVGVALISELATLVNKGSFKSGMIDVLTDLYDAEDFEYRTKSRGIEYVRNPCLSIIGGATPIGIKECIPVVSIGGGFTSRIVFVFSKGSGRLVPRPHRSLENKRRMEDICHDLCEIAKMRGPFALSEDAGKLYDKEYIDFRKHSKLIEDDTLGGYVGRRADILMKVSMLVSASSSSDRLITARDMNVSLGILRKTEESMPNVLRVITSNEVGDIFEQIIRYIQKNKVVGKAELTRKFLPKITAMELDSMMRTLEQADIIVSEVDVGKTKYIFCGKKI